MRTASPASSVISAGSRADEEGHPMPNGIHAPKENGITSHVQQAHPDGKESFLTYFFGGANKNERPALGPQDMISNPNFSSPMSVTSMMESELERKFEQQASLNAPSEEQLQASDREEIEIQLIRKLMMTKIGRTRILTHLD